jgi:transposase
MAFRGVPIVETKEIIRLWLAGIPKKRIAARVGVDPKTVRHYVRAAEQSGLQCSQGEAALTEETLCRVLVAVHKGVQRDRGTGWADCAAHRDTIRKYLAQRVRLTKIRKLLQRQGVHVSYATLHRFAVLELEFGRSTTTVPILDCAPGEELQVDTGWMGYLLPGDDGKRRRFRAWIFTSVATRHRFVYPCFRETTETAIEACEAAWHFFGGVFRVLIPDNTKTIVVTADPLRPKLNQAFLEYSQVRGFLIDPTRVRAPRDKARVERSVIPVRDDCFAGEKLHTIEAAYECARKWCIAEYGMRRHSTTQRRPLEHFQADEKCKLAPVPATPYDPPLWRDPKVGRDHLAIVDKAFYSLPTEFCGKKLRARLDKTLVRFYLGYKLVKTHPRQAPGGRSIDRNDLPPEKTAYAMRDVNFLCAQAAKHGEQTGLFAAALAACDLPWTRMRQMHALLSLGAKYGSTRLEDACRRALDAEMNDVWRLRRMLQRDLQEAPAATHTGIVPIARYLRPAAQYALPLSVPQTTGDDHGPDLA